MTNAQKVQRGDVLVSNVEDTAWYVCQLSDTGNMTILSLDGQNEKDRVSVTFANSCMIFRGIE
jgi:hypothetical protein